MNWNEHSEKGKTTIILSNFENKPKLNSYWLTAFRKYFSLIKVSSASTWHIFWWTFDLRLINSSCDKFCLNQRKTACTYILQRKGTRKYKYRDKHFHWPHIFMLKNPYFLRLFTYVEFLYIKSTFSMFLNQTLSL